MKKFIPFGFVGSAGIIRLIPHISNFTPVNAAVAYGFVGIKNIFLNFISILALLFITDSIFYIRNPLMKFGVWMLYIYPIHLFNGLISKYIVKRPNQYIRVGINCIITSLNFFILSNFFDYLNTDYTEHNFENLINHYIRAIIFYRNEIISNILYTTLYFGLHSWIFREELREEELKERMEIEPSDKQVSDINTNLIINENATATIVKGE